MTEHEYYVKLIDLWNSGDKSGVLAVENFIRKVARDLARTDDGRHKSAKELMDSGNMVSPTTMGQYHRWLDLYPDDAVIDWRVGARGFEEELLFGSSNLDEAGGTKVLHMSFGFPIGWRDRHQEFTGRESSDGEQAG